MEIICIILAINILRRYLNICHLILYQIIFILEYYILELNNEFTV